MNLYVSNEFLATQFPNLIRARTLGRDYACKEEATSVNAHDARKKGHFQGKKFFSMTYWGSDALKPYTEKQNYPDRCAGFDTSCAFFSSMSSAQMIL